MKNIDILVCCFGFSVILFVLSYCTIYVFGGFLFFSHNLGERDSQLGGELEWDGIPTTSSQHLSMIWQIGISFDELLVKMKTTRLIQVDMYASRGPGMKEEHRWSPN